MTESCGENVTDFVTFINVSETKFYFYGLMWIARKHNDKAKQHVRLGKGWFVAAVAGVVGLTAPAFADEPTAHKLQAAAQSIAEISNARRAREPSSRQWGYRAKINPKPYRESPTMQIGRMDGTLFGGEFMTEEAAQVYKAFIGERQFVESHKDEGFMLKPAEVSSEAEQYLLQLDANRPRVRRVVQRARLAAN